MAFIPDFLGVMKLIVDMINSALGLFKTDLETQKKLFSPKNIEVAQREIKKLSFYSHRYRLALDNLKDDKIRDDDDLDEAHSDFSKSLSTVLNLADTWNFNLSDVYIPEFSKKVNDAFVCSAPGLPDLHEIVGRSTSFFPKVLNPNITKRNNRKIKEIQKELLYLTHTQQGFPHTYVVNNKEEFIVLLTNLEKELEGIQTALSEFLRTNWTPKDLS